MHKLRNKYNKIKKNKKKKKEIDYSNLQNYWIGIFSNGLIITSMFLESNWSFILQGNIILLYIINVFMLS